MTGSAITLIEVTSLLRRQSVRYMLGKHEFVHYDTSRLKSPNVCGADSTQQSMTVSATPPSSHLEHALLAHPL